MKFWIEQIVNLGLLAIVFGLLFSGNLAEACIVLAIQLVSLQITIKE